MSTEPASATETVQPIVRHVVHRLDPMRRAMPVVERFKWLGQYKLVVRKDDGIFQKDWEDEFEDVDCGDGQKPSPSEHG